VPAYGVPTCCDQQTRRHDRDSFRRNPLLEEWRNESETMNISELADAIGGLDEPTRFIPGLLSEAKENATGVSR
jgi:hypothetical protein